VQGNCLVPGVFLQGPKKVRAYLTSQLHSSGNSSCGVFVRKCEMC